jgi:hypothetical protein
MPTTVSGQEIQGLMVSFDDKPKLKYIVMESFLTIFFNKEKNKDVAADDSLMEYIVCKIFI